MRAWSSGAKTTHKHSAVVTPLLAEGAGFTLWALVHDGRLWQASGQPETDLVCRPLAEAEATLSAGIVAVGLTALNRKGIAASAADAVRIGGRASVTQRVVPPLVVGGASSFP
jgi:hypothetical protein